MRISLLSAFFLAPFLAQAQVANYTFASSTGTYTPITGGTEIGDNSNDDETFTALPIGFTFSFNGQNFTTFSVSANGFISMGSTIATGVGGTAIAGITDHSGLILTTTSTEPSNVIAGMNLDLVSITGTGNLAYQTLGTAPNRVLVVQWTGYEEYTVTGDDINFQIRLLEGSNQIEVVYGTVTFADPTGFYAQVGLRGTTRTDNHIRESDTDWTNTTKAVLGARTRGILGNTTIGPASGLTYTFSPAGATAVRSAEMPVLSASPSPATQLLTIKGIPAAMMGKPARVTDLSGRQVMAMPLATSLNVQDLPAGLYLLEAGEARLRFLVGR